MSFWILLLPILDWDVLILLFFSPQTPPPPRLLEISHFHGGNCWRGRNASVCLKTELLLVGWTRIWSFCCLLFFLNEWKYHGKLLLSLSECGMIEIPSRLRLRFTVLLFWIPIDYHISLDSVAGESLHLNLVTNLTGWFKPWDYYFSTAVEMFVNLDFSIRYSENN